MSSDEADAPTKVAWHARVGASVALFCVAVASLLVVIGMATGVDRQRENTMAFVEDIHRQLLAGAIFLIVAAAQGYRLRSAVREPRGISGRGSLIGLALVVLFFVWSYYRTEVDAS